MSAFGSAWSLLKNFDENPVTQEEMDDYRRVMDAPPPRRTPQMDDDPFRMKKPDMSDQIEQMLAEIQRREGRKNPDFHDQDYDSFYYRDKYDRENPQDNQLLNTTRPQMNDRMEALRAEMARRAGRREAKRQDEENPPLDPSTEEYERAFDTKHADMQSFGAPEGMTNEEYGIIDQPDSEHTKELQGQALQDYIKQRFG